MFTKEHKVLGTCIITDSSSPVINVSFFRGKVDLSDMQTDDFILNLNDTTKFLKIFKINIDTRTLERLT